MTGTAAAQKDKSLRHASLDIHTLEFGPEGVLNFFWPLAPHEANAFSKRLTENYAALMQEAEDGFGRDAVLPYKLFGKYFLCEAVAVFQGDLLLERCAKDGINPEIPAGWRMWPALKAGRTPEYPGFMKTMREGPVEGAAKRRLFDVARIKRIFSRLRPKASGMTIDGLRLGKITPARLQNAIMATQRTEFISRHAAQIDKDVYFMHSAGFFRRIGDAALAQATGNRPVKLEDRILGLVDANYALCGTALSAAGREYLTGLLREGAACLKIHHARLLEAPEKLPRHLWTGTGGIIWDLMLRLAVSETGGFTEGHHHGSGMGHLNEGIVSFLELWGCHRFVCINEGEVVTIKATAPAHPRLQNDIPEIMGLKTEPSSWVPKALPKNKIVKTVMLLGTIYDRDRGRMGPLIPDVVYVDWQSRLISWLRGQGYEVIFKPHPESPLMPPAAFHDALGARIETRPFEEVLSQADLVLFDYLYTTTFRSALLSALPVVVADFGDTEWYDPALPLLEKRICRVMGHHDEQNRRQLNWSRLRWAFDTAPERAASDEFVKTYML